MTKDWWKDLNLQASDFNKVAYQNFICQHLYETTGKKVECTPEIYDDADNAILPQDLPAGYMTQRLLHYTIIFQAFVFLQLWNQFNARHIGQFDLNPFKGFFSNFIFLGIIIFASAVQAIMVEYGGAAVKVYPLTKEQQLISIGFGALSLIIGILIKFIPLKLFENIKMNDEPAKEEELERKVTNVLKKSSTLRQRQQNKVHNQ